MGLVGRAWSCLFKECPFLVWQLGEHDVTTFGIDQKACCYCTTTISKALEEIGLVSPRGPPDTWNIVYGRNGVTALDAGSKGLEVKDDLSHGQYLGVQGWRQSAVGPSKLKSQCTVPQAAQVQR